MKRPPTILAFIACGILLACGGGRTAHAPPDPLKPAGKALTKGITLYRKGCYQRSAAMLLEAHELYAAADNRAGVATALNNIGNVHRARKDLERSLLYYDAAADVFEEISDTRGYTRAQVNRAAALVEEGRLAEAEEALAAARTRGEAETETDVSWTLTHGVLLVRKGLAGPAEAEMRRALEMAGDKQPERLAGVHYALARLLLETDRAAEAARHAQEALDADRRAGAFQKTAADLSLLGEALLHSGNASDAAAAFRRAMKIYALLGDTEAVSETAKQLKATGVESVHPVTLEFIEQWLKGDVRSNICR
jgi:tetratricopeptide (TPR) repeat protein